MNAKNTIEQQDTRRASFLSAEQALLWSVELLRCRRLPKLTRLWREVVDEADFVAKAWRIDNDLLPADPDERWGLALKVDALLADMAASGRDGQDAAALLKLWAWGDWVDEARLAGALAMQEKLRRQGIRTRIAYRYTYAQLAVYLKCDRKAAWRKVKSALLLLENLLLERGLLPTAEPGRGPVDDLKKDVHRYDFKMYDEESC